MNHINITAFAVLGGYNAKTLLQIFTMASQDCIKMGKSFMEKIIH